MLPAADVLAIVDLLAAAGVRAWVDGGWGIDALLGEQTRDHADLDIAIAAADADRFNDAVGAAGFVFYRDDGPFNWVVRDGAGRTVDVHLFDPTCEQPGDDGRPVYGPAGLAYEVRCFEARGIIGGREVDCCTAEFMMRSHSTYTLDADDLRDVLALHRRFGLPLLPAHLEAQQRLGDPG